MDQEKLDKAREIVSAHVGNVERRKVGCAFYRFGENSRCLLEDFFKVDGELDSQEARTLCKYRHARRKIRCSYSHNPEIEEGESNKLRGENKRLKIQVENLGERVAILRVDLNDASEQLAAYKKKYGEIS